MFVTTSSIILICGTQNRCKPQGFWALYLMVLEVDVQATSIKLALPIHAGLKYFTLETYLISFDKPLL